MVQPSIPPPEAKRVAPLLHALSVIGAHLQEVDPNSYHRKGTAIHANVVALRAILRRIAVEAKSSVGTLDSDNVGTIARTTAKWQAELAEAKTLASVEPSATKRRAAQGRVEMLQRTIDDAVDADYVNIAVTRMMPLPLMRNESNALSAATDRLVEIRNLERQSMSKVAPPKITIVRLLDAAEKSWKAHGGAAGHKYAALVNHRVHRARNQHLSPERFNTLAIKWVNYGNRHFGDFPQYKDLLSEYRKAEHVIALDGESTRAIAHFRAAGGPVIGRFDDGQLVAGHRASHAFITLSLATVCIASAVLIVYRWHRRYLGPRSTALSTPAAAGDASYHDVQ